MVLKSVSAVVQVDSEETAMTHSDLTKESCLEAIKALQTQINTHLTSHISGPEQTNEESSSSADEDSS